MWELDYKESWALKNWCFWTVVLEKVLESPLNCKEIKPLNPKGNQSWIFIGRTDAESWNSNTLATWCKEPTHWKRPWCWERVKEGREGDDREWDNWMVSLTQWAWSFSRSGSWWWTGRSGWKKACSPWARKDLDTTEWLNWTDGQSSSHGTNLSTWVSASISSPTPKFHCTAASVFNCNCTLCQRRHWRPTPVLLPGKSHGRRSLVGCSPWGR